MRDHLAWLFKPTKLLGPARSTADRAKILRVRGWETLDLVSDRETLEQINRTTGRSYFGGSGNEFLVPLFGEQSVFTLDGDRHRLARKIIGGSLTQRRTEQMAPVLQQIIASELDESFLCGGTIKVGPLARRLTMRMACVAIRDCSEPETATALLPLFESVTGFLANIVSYQKKFYKKAPFPLNRLIDGRIAKVRAKSVQTRRDCWPTRSQIVGFLDEARLRAGVRASPAVRPAILAGGLAIPAQPVDD